MPLRWCFFSLKFLFLEKLLYFCNRFENLTFKLMEKPIKLILIIFLLGAGLSLLITEKKSIDQLVTLENCPYRDNFDVLTKDGTTVTIHSRICYDPTEVKLKDVEYGNLIAKQEVRKIVFQYTLDELLHFYVGDIADVINDSIHQYNEKMHWNVTMIAKKSNTISETSNVRTKTNDENIEVMPCMWTPVMNLLY